MSARERLTSRQREIVGRATETLTQTAAAIAAGMHNVDLGCRGEVYRAAYSRTKVRLAMALAVLDELAGEVNAEHLATVLAALGDAAAYRRERGEEVCTDCAEFGQACDPHRDDLRFAGEYDDLAARLRGGAS